MIRIRHKSRTPRAGFKTGGLKLLPKQQSGKTSFENESENEIQEAGSVEKQEDQ